MGQFFHDDDNLDEAIKAAGIVFVMNRNAADGRIDDTNIWDVDSVFNYNGFGEREHEEYFFGSVSIAEFDDTTRDELGRITQAIEVLPGSVNNVWDYQYDDAGRLWDVELGGNDAYEYLYDDQGRRTQVTDYLKGVQYSLFTYDAQDRLTYLRDTNANEWTYTYTLNGERETKDVNNDVTVYDYDPWGNLILVDLPSGLEIGYEGDPKGRRIARYVDSSFDKGWVYGEDLQILAEINSNGDVISRFYYGSQSHSPDIMYHAPTGQPYRFVKDYRGSIRAVVNADTGHVIQRMNYTPFGVVITDTNPGFQPFGFAGGLYDPDTELVRFGARDYDPFTGRWLAKDPIRFAGGDTNLYSHVAQDPINGIDPTGKYTQTIPIVVGIKFGKGAAAAAAKAAAGALAAAGAGLLYWCKEQLADPDDTKEHCSRLYYRCIQGNWPGPCDLCLRKCVTHEEWDFELCPSPGR